MDVGQFNLRYNFKRQPIHCLWNGVGHVSVLSRESPPSFYIKKPLSLVTSTLNCKELLLFLLVYVLTD